MVFNKLQSKIISESKQCDICSLITSAVIDLYVESVNIVCYRMQKF